MRLLPYVLGVLAILLLPAVGATKGTALQGEFSRDPALTVSGELHANATDWVLRYPVPIHAGLVLRADRVHLLIIEQRTYIGALSLPRVVMSDPLLGNPNERNLRDLHVDLLSAVPETEWALYGSNRSSLELGASACRMTLARPADPELARTFQRSIEGLKVPLVNAACRTGSVTARDGVDWSIWNTTLLLRHRTSDGVLHYEHLRTGVHMEQSSIAPHHYDEVRRRAVLRWSGGNQTFALPAAQGVRLMAPVVAASGMMGLEQGSGALEWGGALFQEPPTDPPPEGRFLIRSPDGVHLRVQGTTRNAPPSAPWFFAQELRLAAAVAAGTVSLVLLGALALFARLNAGNVGKHPARAAILAFLERSPGARLTEIQAAVSLPRSTALHHLRALERANLVVHRRVGKFLIYGCAAHTGTLDDPAFLAQRVRRNELLLQILQEQPGLRQQEIATKMGVTQSYVSRILAKLERDGLVERTEHDRRSFRLRGAAPTGRS